MPRKKIRIDELLVEIGLAESRQKAHALILGGRVYVDSQKIEKAGVTVSPASVVQVRGLRRFVGRGGEKLQAALEYFHLDPRGRVCVDLGTSTGGFVDCLLQGGAARVYAFDTGRGQIAWSLAADPRVKLRDQYNVRDLRAEDLPEPFFLMTADLSFISLRKVLPAIAEVFCARAQQDSPLLLLVKPQFELPRDAIAEGGLVIDEAAGRKTVDQVAAAAARLGFSKPAIFPSPLRGAEGNQEYFLKLRGSGGAGERESGRAGERESGRAGERESGRAGSGRAGGRKILNFGTFDLRLETFDCWTCEKIHHRDTEDTLELLASSGQLNCKHLIPWATVRADHLRLKV